MAVKKKPKLSGLAAKAWKLMSIISRTKDADKDGFVKCVTCEKVQHWKEMDAGHFFHASKQRPISYDDRNIHAQCTGCNRYRDGARDEYSCVIVKRYGPETLDELRTLKHSGKELKRADLEDLIVALDQKVPEQFK